MTCHQLRSLSCKSQSASLTLSFLRSYLLLRRHWNMGNEFLLAFFTFFFLATFLIRLGKKKKSVISSLLSAGVIKTTFFTSSARRSQRENDRRFKHNKQMNGTEQQMSMISTTFRSCSLIFSALLLSFFVWLFLCCGTGVNVKLYSLLLHTSLAANSKATKNRGAS